MEGLHLEKSWHRKEMNDETKVGKALSEIQEEVIISVFTVIG